MVARSQLLGAMEARLDGRLVEVGHMRRWCVLAALLIDANRAVPPDQLVDRVWGERAPQRARDTLYGYLSRLRRAFGTTAEVAILRQPGGYVLEVDPETVDVHRFQRLTAAARAAADGDAVMALLDEALALWRGEAFAALDTPWLNAARAGLDRARLAAELDRNDLALHRGRHAELLTAVAAAAAAHPLDERLAGQLMLALYRSGRQGDHAGRRRARRDRRGRRRPPAGAGLVHRRTCRPGRRGGAGRGRRVRDACLAARLGAGHVPGPPRALGRPGHHARGGAGGRGAPDRPLRA